MAVPAGVDGARVGPALMAGPSVVQCRSCDGLSFTLDPCRCTYGGNRLLVAESDSESARRSAGEAYQDCLECQGVGTVGRPCHDCGQTGRRRAQLVLTMANLDTGAVASANVVPGVVEPAPWPGDGGGSWHLPLAPLLRDLAAAVGVGAGSWTDVRQPGDPDGPLVFLPRAWRPEHSATVREVLEAEAIAGESTDAWRLYLGRSTVAPPREAPAELGRLCRLADLLCLDLVVEARRLIATAGLTWAIRFEVPGGPVPSEARGYADDLTTAIGTTTVLDACDGLEERGQTAPAHHVTLGQPPPDPPTIDLDQLERRILADCLDLATGDPTAGAQAIWRDGRWWHTSLRTAGTSETLTEWSTGQIYSRRATKLRRGWQPPAPSWQDSPIPYVDCSDCDPHSRLRRCDCRLGTDRADPDCPKCAGSGRSPSLLRCYTCRGTRRLHSEAAITITDLAGRVVHLSWRSDAAGWRTGEFAWRDDPADHQSDRAGSGGDGRVRPVGEETWRTGNQVPAPQVATHPGGKPLHQLPDHFRLAGWADHFGVRPEDLVELDGGGSLDHSLRDGTVTLHRPDADPLTEYLRWAARGRPGGRLLVLARRPDVPPLADLVRLVLGLRLTVTITLVDHIRNAGDLRLIQGESWDVTIDPLGRLPTPADPPTYSTPEAATAHCLEYLELAIAGNVPDNPDQQIPVPQTPTPIAVDDPIPLLRRLARHHPGQSVAVHYDGTTCHIWLRERDDVRQLATAPTLPAAIGALGL
ncbi:hypothetical protein O7626_05885 [Micromonospora sp. WMMD1102]|uniref:hypothetical protein n=1 Tax=Micromonospora sp. WMMD1102 TaxID=3016105 RepID=UPI002414FCB0|nr:hypothetical protein [Micromonospora sp. WMMD1102]MDG4785467.1 hypothetical protein [Micromonospora sp. WMMD1102]